jgi:hypothetical protein
MISSPSAFPCSSTDPVQIRAELTARFVRDAVPMRDQLHGRAAHLTGNRVDAEDLLQETMLSADRSNNSPASSPIRNSSSMAGTCAVVRARPSPRPWSRCSRTR